MPDYREPVSFTKTNQYGCGPDDEDEVYTVAEWIEHCIQGSFIDYDGCGYLVKGGKSDPSVMVTPSMVTEGTFDPQDATHVVWFNR